MIRELRLISKCKTSQPGIQTITMHILPNISRSNVIQTTKIGQLLGYNVKIFFFKSHAENGARKLVPDLKLDVQ